MPTSNTLCTEVIITEAMEALNRLYTNAEAMQAFKERESEAAGIIWLMHEITNTKPSDF